MGERYKTVTKEFKGLVKGEYGKTPVAIDPEFQKKILGDEEPITCRPADLLQPEFETMKKEAAEWTEQEEDISHMQCSLRLHLSSSRTDVIESTALTVSTQTLKIRFTQFNNNYPTVSAVGFFVCGS